jgi:zinc protease
MGFRQDDLDVDYVANRNDLINSVTLEDVKRVAAAYMRPENFTFVLVGQPE